MSVVALYFGFLFFGFLIGNKIIPRDKEIKYSNKIFPALVFFVIFLMGIIIGSDGKVISSLGSIGAASFILTILAMSGSVTGVIVLRKLLKIDRKGIRHE